MSRKSNQCRVQGCSRASIAQEEDYCYTHARENRYRLMVEWREAIEKRGANCEGRSEEFTQCEGIPKPTKEKAATLCHGCASRPECRAVKKTKMLTDGVILDGEVIGAWGSL